VLTQVPSAAQVDSDLDVEVLLQAAKRRARIRRRLQLGCVLALAFALALGGLWVFGGASGGTSVRSHRSMPPPSRGGTTGQDRTVNPVDSLASDGPFPTAASIAAVGRHLWVSYGSPGYIGLREISLSNGRLIHVVEGRQYGFFPEPTILGVIGNRLLVCNDSPDGSSVTAIDDRTGRLLGMQPGPCGGAAYYQLGVRVAGGYWVAAQPQWQQTRSILDVDATTGAVLGSVRMPEGFFAGTMAADGGTLYVQNLFGTRVALVDLNSDTLVRTIRMCGATPPAQPMDSGGATKGLVVAGGWLWTTCGDHNDFYGYLSRVNLATGRIQALASLGSQTTNLFAYGRSVWVSGFRKGLDNTAQLPLLKVDVVTGRVVGYAEGGDTLEASVVLDGHLFVIANSFAGRLSGQIAVVSASTGRQLRVFR
jgi:hypothetical protein